LAVALAGSLAQAAFSVAPGQRPACETGPTINRGFQPICRPAQEAITGASTRWHEQLGYAGDPAVNLPTSLTHSYDPNGNLLSDGFRGFDYDDENQLIRITVTNGWKSEFTYDGQMRRRIRKEFTWQNSAWLQTNEVRYIYDGSLVVQERDANNLPVVTLTRQGLRLLARSDMRSVLPVHAYFHIDGNQNVTALINSSQAAVARYLYDPFGNLVSSSGPLADANVYQFACSELHRNSGLIYFVRRFYDPTTQRWLNRDPLGERAGANLYAYSGNCPISLLDPLGLDPTLGELFWQNAYENGLSDAGRFANRIGSDVVGMATSSLDRMLDPIGSAYRDYQSLAGLISFAKTLSNDRCARHRALGALQNYLTSPEAIADGTLALEMFLAGRLLIPEAEAGQVLQAARSETQLEFDFVSGDLSGRLSSFSAGEGGTYSAIGSTGKVGEQWLAENVGGQQNAFFRTSQGARFVDNFANGIANESKVGYTSLTSDVQLQITKDVELIQTEQIQGATWHFFQSPVTGLGGPSQPLLNALQQNRINVIIH
jgi:RHS repeat-associated protein